MNTQRAVKIGLAFVNITYIFCYVILGLFPGVRASMLPYLLHLNAGPVENVFTLSNFIVGLILWNVIVGVSVWLVGLLASYIKN